MPAFVTTVLILSELWEYFYPNYFTVTEEEPALEIEPWTGSWVRPLAVSLSPV